MARPPASDPRSKVVMVRFTEKEHAKLQRERGTMNLSAYIRSRLPLGK